MARCAEGSSFWAAAGAVAACHVPRQGLPSVGAESVLLEGFPSGYSYFHARTSVATTALVTPNKYCTGCRLRMQASCSPRRAYKPEAQSRGQWLV